MGSTDMLFLFGLGVVYAVAFRLVRNGLVLWPLLTPLGSFFANLEAGEIDLPWAAIAGFVDVATIMTTLVVIAHRRQRHLRAPIEPHHDTTTDDPDHSGATTALTTSSLTVSTTSTTVATGPATTSPSSAAPTSAGHLPTTGSDASRPPTPRCSFGPLASPSSSPGGCGRASIIEATTFEMSGVVSGAFLRFQVT